MLACLVLAGCAGTRAVSPAPSLTGLQALTEPLGFVEPAWSEDGRQISLSGQGSQGLYLVPAEGGDVQVLASRDVVAFRHRWQDGVIVVAPRGETAALQVSPRDGTVDELPEWTPQVWIDRDDLFASVEGEAVRLTRGEDRFLDPVLSPGGTHVAFVGLVSGVHVIELSTGELAHLGAGTRPAWSPDGSYVLFERTEDDGANLTGADLWCWSSHNGVVTPLTATSGALERFPAVSPDGTKVAFVRDGALWIGEFVGETR